jgi:hypothetical protein
MQPKHLITILLLMAVLILPVSAYSLNQYGGYFPNQTYSASFPHVIAHNASEVQAYCQAVYGKDLWVHTVNTWYWNAAQVQYGNGNAVLGQNITVSTPEYFTMEYACVDIGYKPAVIATRADLVPQVRSVNFSVSETGNFTKKLSGVVITISNGQSVTTNAGGWGNLSVTPNSSTYTYGATKTGYGTLSAQDLGGYGEAGGIVYVEMQPGTSGNVTTYIQAVDGATGGQVHYSNIQIKDVNQNLWTNVTNDFDGTHYIDTLQSTTIDAYADMTGYTSASRLGLAPFSGGLYEIVLWPAGSLLDPGPGNVNLIVLVNDRTTSSGIGSASVSAMAPSGAVEGSSTGTTGTVTFVVPNMSVIHVTAKKDGYTAGTGTITTTAFGPDTLRIELTKATVTPVVTATPLPGEVTARPTYLPGCEPGGDPALCSRNQDSSLWAGLRRDAPMLYDLAFLACIVGLLFLAIKAMKLK